MTNTGDHNDALFDRLVDGEMSADERRRLLASLDDTADGWRRCALAFLEAQSWRQGMKQSIAAPQEKPVVTVASTGQGGHFQRGLSFAIAASLLAFAAGWLIRSPQPGGVIRDQLAETTVESVSPEDVENSVGPNDAVTLLVRDTAGKPQRVRVPLVESDGFDDRTMLTALPEGYRDTFQERGLDLRGRRRYAPLYFEQNNQLVPMVVPVDDAYVVPASRQIY